MNKKNKVLLKIAILLICFGGIFCLVALIGGSNFEQLTRLLNSSPILGYFYRNNNEELDSDSKIWESSLNEKATNIPLNEQFSEVNIKLESIPIVIHKSDSNFIQLNELSISDISYKVKKNCLSISDSGFSLNPNNLLKRQSFNEQSLIELYLSEQVFANFSIELMSGSVYSSDFSISTDKLKVTNDYGIIQLENVASNNTKIINDSGEVLVSGYLNNNTIVSTQNGKTVLNLENKANQCSFYGAEKGLGSINVNGSIPNQDKTSTKNAHKFDLQCDLGTIIISTKD